MLNRSVPFPSSDDAIHYVSALSDDEILTTKDGVMVEHSRQCSYQIRTWKSKQDREKGVPATPFINDKGGVHLLLFTRWRSWLGRPS